MKTVIYLEGAGDSRPSIQACKRAFSQFFEKAGLKGRMPEILPCGSRNNASIVFRKALANPAVANQNHLLLVDSEEPVTAASKWEHLANTKDGKISKPSTAREDHVFLMVQCMEAWFFADRDALKSYFNHNRSEKNLPDDRQVEQHSKDRIFQTLESISRESSKGSYGKGKHSFEILGKIDPEKVCEASPRASEFVSRLKELLS